MSRALPQLHSCMHVCRQRASEQAVSEDLLHASSSKPSQLWFLAALDARVKRR